MKISRILLILFIAVTSYTSGFSSLFNPSEVSKDADKKDTVVKVKIINRADVIPAIVFPGITQADFNDAFNVLNECTVTEEPRFGFNFPFIAPGGHYGGCWWQLDAAVSLTATKWANQQFSENMLRGFIGVQKPDGRIPLYGYDKVPGFPECSSLPKLFSGGYQVLKQSRDKELVLTAYNCLKRYLDWWFSDVRKDSATGLITGVFEESFPPIEDRLKAVAQVDLNVEVADGCNKVSLLAKELGKDSDFKKYSALERDLKASINNYMWDDSAGAYYAYNIIEKKRDSKLVCYTFDPFRLGISPENRIQKLIKILTGDRYFNWSGNAITSVAKTDKSYNETTGTYNGAPAWSGDIWTLRNEAVIQGLEDIGRYDLAAYLSLKTVNLFNANYVEFIKPSDGSGHGEKRYAWSAAQYIKILVENIFGIDYNRFNHVITIRPNLPDALTGKSVSLEKLLLPDGNRLSLYLTKKEGSLNIKYNITGSNNDMNVRVVLPSNEDSGFKVINRQGKNLKFLKIKQKAATLYQVANGKRYMDDVRFIKTAAN